MADNEFRALLDELGHLRHAHYEQQQQQQQQPRRGGEGVTRRQYELQPAFLSRFLRCTKGDVNKAARLIDSYWRVRDANGLPGIKSSTTDAQVVEIIRQRAIRLPVMRRASSSSSSTNRRRACGGGNKQDLRNALYTLFDVESTTSSAVDARTIAQMFGRNNCGTSSSSPNTVADSDEDLNENADVVPLRDSEGRRVIFAQPALLNAGNHDTSALINAFHVIMDFVLEEDDDDDDDGDDDDESDNFEWCSQKNNHTIAANHLTQKNGVVIISDQSHPPMTIKMYVNARPSMVAILRSISGAMPVRVRQLVIVNAPAAFRVAWKILCSLPGPVISPKLKERLMLVVS